MNTVHVFTHGFSRGGTEPLEGEPEGHEVEEEEEDAGDDGPPVQEHEQEADGGHAEQRRGQEAGEEPQEQEAAHPDRGGGGLVLPHQGVDVEVEHRLDDGEDGEEDGGHGQGGQAGHAAEAVRDAGGARGLVPGERQDTAGHQEQQQHWKWELLII